MRAAAAIAAGGLLLVPVVLAGSAATGILPVASSGARPGSPPTAGDLLAALRRAQSQPEDYGAGGKLPEADTLSADLLAALAGSADWLGPGSGAQAAVPPGPLGIPGVMLGAYQRAEQTMAASSPRCGITWPVLAAIGRIESNHARGGAVDDRGTTLNPILGPQLSGGPGIAAIPDTDDGRLDGDTVWDRAVGPMQFIPGTWARFGADGNNDGTASPHNAYDAARSAAGYLCSGGDDLRDQAALAKAVFRYNHSEVYVANVLTWAAAYAAGVTPLPSTPAPVLPPAPPSTQPTPSNPPTTTPPTSTATSSTTTTTTPSCPTATPTSEPSSTTGTTTPTPTTTVPGCPPPTSTTTAPPVTTVDLTTTANSTTVDSTSAEGTTANPPASTSTVAGTSAPADGSSTDTSSGPATTTSLPAT